VITAFILLTVEPGRVKPVAEALLEVPGVYEVYSVAGPYDVVAVARVAQHEDLSDLVTDRVGALGGVETTETLIAFRAYAKKDPGLLWDVGGESAS
jgi:DNA-binding Lrp family transcriptional regulator